MDTSLKENAQGIAIDYFLKSPTGQNLQRAMTVVEDVQKKVISLYQHPEEEMLRNLKVGTILTMCVLTKMSGGQKPKDFTSEDWKEIGDKVFEYAIEMAPDQYTLLVFSMYAGYIETSANLVREHRGLKEEDESVKKIVAVAAALRDKSELFEKGEITETAYVEECLWLCLEGVMKLLSAYTTSVMPAEYGKLADAVATYAFEYGRLMLYQREQALLEAYLQNQKVLDGELQEKYRAFLQQLEKDRDQFNVLLGKAFDSDFSSLLKNSVAIARASGVSEEEILDSVEKIDDYFL